MKTKVASKSKARTASAVLIPKPESTTPTAQAISLPQRAVRTVDDLMSNLDDEIVNVKNGNLTESKARIVAKNRQLQLQAFQLLLGAARLEARFRPEVSRRLGLPDVTAKDANLIDVLPGSAKNLN